MHKKTVRTLLGLAAAGAMIVAPLLASAQAVTASAAATTTASSSDIAALMAELQSLLAQVGSLKQQIAQIAGTSTLGMGSGDHGMMNGSGTLSVLTGMLGMELGSTLTASGMSMVMPMPGMCPALSRNLSMGVRGSDVMQLQEFLMQQGSSILASGTATGYFGPLTAQAVVQFQQQNGISSSTAGFVGPITRKFFETRCRPMPMGSSTMMMEGSGTMPMPPMGSSSYPLLRPGMPPPPHEMGDGSGTPPMTNASGTGPQIVGVGAHCGGNIMHAPMCGPGLRCVNPTAPAMVGDIGGICMVITTSSTVSVSSTQE